MNRWIDGLSAAEYLADPCDTPSLSSSVAHTLLTRSPWHAWRAHPKLGRMPARESDALDLGEVLHAMVLGEWHRFEAIDVPDWRTKAARELREAAEARGRIVLKRADFDELAQKARAIQEDMARRGIELETCAGRHIERTAVWTEDGVLCRARIDCIDLRAGVVFDLKTTREATDHAIERAVRSYGYHVQAAAYVSAVEHIEPELAGRVRFVLLFVETDTLDVVPVELGSGMADLGRRRWKRAVDAWGRCLRSGTWPRSTHAKEPRRIECSEWAHTADQVDSIVLAERMDGL